VTDSGAGSTSGAVTVTEMVPVGLTLVSMSGTGWTCPGGGITCTRSDALAAGVSYPAINATVNVSSTAPVSVINTAAVSGGGETNTANDQATDATTITSPSSGTATSIWSATAVPAVGWHLDSPTTVGLRFRSDMSGQISGVRFYKGAGNNGSHIGMLYSSTGTLLAQATFSGETASGWQQANFTTPIAVAANTTYVAAYFSNSGFGYDSGYFTSKGVDNVPLHALRSGVDGANGLYAYGASSMFQTNSWFDANYWVDVAFSPTATATSIWPRRRCRGTRRTTIRRRQLGLSSAGDVSGTITGIRFYKGAGNNGMHIGRCTTRVGLCWRRRRLAARRRRGGSR
jgi:hypothetical protein